MGNYSITRHRRASSVSATNFITISAKMTLLIIHIHRFVAINGVGVYLYAIVYQAQDEEEYGGAWEVMKEGMLSSSAFFVVNQFG